MTKKKLSKIIVDVLMFLDFIFLMSHGTVRNLGWHAYAGMALFALFPFPCHSARAETIVKFGLVLNLS